MSQVELKLIDRNTVLFPNKVIKELHLKPGETFFIDTDAITKNDYERELKMEQIFNEFQKVQDAYIEEKNTSSERSYEKIFDKVCELTKQMEALN